MAKIHEGHYIIWDACIFIWWGGFQVAHCCGFTEASSCYRIGHHCLGVPLWNGLLPLGLPDLCICAWVRYSNNFYVPYLLGIMSLTCHNGFLVESHSCIMIQVCFKQWLLTTISSKNSIEFHFCELLKRIYWIDRLWCHPRNSVLEQIVTLQEFLRLPPLIRVIMNLKKTTFWRKNVRHSQWPASLLSTLEVLIFKHIHLSKAQSLWAVFAIHDQFMNTVELGLEHTLNILTVKWSKRMAEGFTHSHTKDWISVKCEYEGLHAECFNLQLTGILSELMTSYILEFSRISLKTCVKAEYRHPNLLSPSLL